MKAKNKEIQENEIDISVEDFCARLELEVLHKSRSGVMHISTFNINRPGLQLAGYYEHFSAERVQVIGEMETAFLLFPSYHGCWKKATKLSLRKGGSGW